MPAWCVFFFCFFLSFSNQSFRHHTLHKVDSWCRVQGPIFWDAFVQQHVPELSTVLLWVSPSHPLKQILYVQHELWPHSGDDLLQINTENAMAESWKHAQRSRSESTPLSQLKYSHRAVLVNGTKGKDSLVLIAITSNSLNYEVIREDASRSTKPYLKDAVYLTRMFSLFPQFPLVGAQAWILQQSRLILFVQHFETLLQKYLASVRPRSQGKRRDWLWTDKTKMILYRLSSPC